MKKLMMILVTVFSVMAMAQDAVESFPQPPIPPMPPPHSITVFGQGSAQGICNGTTAVYSCIQQIKRSSEQDGQADTQRACWSQGGQGASFAFCNTYCNPSMLPAGAPNQMVHCRSNCNANCQVH